MWEVTHCCCPPQPMEATYSRTQQRKPVILLGQSIQITLFPFFLINLMDVQLFLPLCLVSSALTERNQCTFPLAQPHIEEVYKWCLQCEALCLGWIFAHCSSGRTSVFLASRPAAAALSDLASLLSSTSSSFSHPFSLSPVIMSLPPN